MRGQQMGSVPTIDIHNIENSKSRNFDFDFDFYDADAQESLRSSTILGRNDPRVGRCVVVDKLKKKGIGNFPDFPFWAYPWEVET